LVTGANIFSFRHQQNDLTKVLHRPIEITLTALRDNHDEAMNPLRNEAQVKLDQWQQEKLG